MGTREPLETFPGTLGPGVPACFTGSVISERRAEKASGPLSHAPAPQLLEPQFSIFATGTLMRAWFKDCLYKALYSS